jgi:hypothetical protein
VERRIRRRLTMSGHIGGQVRALPFTGLASLPFVLIGLLLSGLGLLMTKVRPKAKSLEA